MSFCKRIKEAWLKGWHGERTELVRGADGVHRPGLPAGTSTDRVGRSWRYIRAFIKGSAYAVGQIIMEIFRSKVVTAIRKVTGHPLGMLIASLGILYGIDCLLAFCLGALPVGSFASFLVAIFGLCIWGFMFYFVIVSLIIFFNWLFKGFFKFFDVAV